MGSTNAMLTQLIQDAVLKLCTQNVVFNKSLEIDGIICVSPGDEAKEIVVKMHRTIMKPNPVQETFNNASDWSSNMYSNSRSPRQPQDPPPFRQRPPIQQQRLPKVRNNIENTMSTPDQNTSTTFNTSHQATGVPSATLDTPGGVVGTSENVPCIKEEPAFTSSPKSLKRSISGSEDQDAPDHSADKQRKLEQNTDTTDNQNMENINIKQEKEEPITIELGDDDDEEEDGGGGYDEDSTAGASWMGDNTLDTSQDNMADQSSENRPDDVKYEPYKPTTHQFACSHCKGKFQTFGEIERHFIAAHANSSDEAKNESGNQQNKKDENVPEIQQRNPRFSSDDCEFDKDIAVEYLNNDFVLGMSPKITPSKRLQCCFCSKTFVKLGELNHHVMIIHRGRRFVCKKCGRRYTTKAKLKSHIIKHHQ